ncbi:bifunctional copper resistance protein CopD/cytochrome c oxidase assembly protein [Brachybacterium huguangmaarense]|uniref:Bifunctional copper resistance protein CopD/cytochrome c oxidase assembly protein n=1 Tax=Brachybacterium huguangmaarense TaxID=1652028 RepID=A0ABY6FY06_9MICO|nr:bifunctional copper resistance protein CopD/cytochrome c oxidase assembly protein [Brachybacterium huguangmaarense]UYG15594.1 bifunctional copper resistance protein CopD/cytochrome c oxidase assembly protein [Brachybacterium huguangmaarense]
MSRSRAPHGEDGAVPARPHGALIALGAVVLAALVALLGILSTGAAVPGRLVPAPGLVTWGTPVVRALHHGALLGTVGCAWIVVLLMPPPHREDGTRLVGARAHLARLGGACALVWGAASLALMLLGAAEAVGGLTDLWYVALSTELGRTQLAVAIAAVLAAAFLLLGRSTVASAWGLAAAMLGVALLGLAGHAGSSLDHTNAVNAMALHLAGTAIWAGPLLVMLCCPRVIGEAMPVVVRRFSPWALAGVAALAVSGVLNASIRLDSPLDVATTAYGRLVALKALGLVALAVLGAVQRRRLGDALRFRHLALTESVLLAAVIGLSIALSRSAPPVPQDVPATGQLRILALVGYLPPHADFSVASLFTQARPDWVATVIAATMAGLYLAGVLRLRRRGDAWSLGRTIPFVLGCVALWWVTSGGPAAYGRFRFDAHMVQHMAMMMIVPPLWVLGAPVTLLTRAAAPRTDGSRGMREWVLAVLHSRYSRVISFPPMAGAIFAGSLIVFYFSPLFELAQYTHVGHVVMTVHFLLAGYLFAWVLIGIDPAPRPLNPVLKLVTLLVTLSFHAFFGVAVVSATWIIAQDWYHALGMYTDAQLALIQTRGGSIMWGVSEIPTLAYAIILAVQWTRSEERRARQYDRKAARDNDAELTEYNEYLRSLRQKDGPGRPR